MHAEFTKSLKNFLLF